MSSIIVGVDPGFSGAVAVIRAELNAPRQNIEICEILDTPVTEHNGRTEIDSYNLSIRLGKYRNRATMVVLENVNAMPGNGVSSMFRFGVGFGQVLAVLQSLHPEKPILRPPPAVWKASMGITADKNSSRAAAIKYSPESRHILFSRKKDSDRAEAFLLALFGARSLGLDLNQVSFSGENSEHRGISSIF